MPRIGIVGTGMIASSLAVLTAGHGMETRVFARSTQSAERFGAAFSAHWQLMVQNDVATQEQADICATYAQVSTDFSALRDAEVVFECIVEDLGQKADVYRRVEQTCPDVRAICSVSSSIVPDQLAASCTRYADRVVVTHPFNPVHMVPYVEVCTAEATDPKVRVYVVELLEALDRKPVVLKKPTPGFIGNRLQFALWREALALVEEGIADPHDIDTALRYSFCPRYTSIGIFEHFDAGGLALNRAICKNLFPVLSDRKDVPPIIDSLMERGHTGAGAGRGFYDWKGVDKEAYAARVNEPYWKFCSWHMPDAPAAPGAQMHPGGER